MGWFGEGTPSFGELENFKLTNLPNDPVLADSAKPHRKIPFRAFLPKSPFLACSRGVRPKPACRHAYGVIL